MYIKKGQPDRSGKNNPMYGRRGKDNPNFGRKNTPETIIKMKANHANFKGSNHPMFGKHPSLETRKKMSMAQCGERGSGWKGGISLFNKRTRASLEYREWRTKVFERDNYTCQICGERSREGKIVFLQADHIKPFSEFPDLRFDINNGRTLCRDCHKKTDTFGWSSYHLLRKNNYSGWGICIA